GGSASFTWSLSGPRGAVVSGRAFGSSDSVDVGGNPLLALTAGDYTLTVDAAGAATGSYRFRLLDLSAAAALTPGSEVTGQLEPGSATHAYRFSAVAGERYYFDARSLSGGPYWRLLDPLGRVVFGPSHMGSDVEPAALGLTGDYTLLLEGRFGESGGVAQYRFNVQPVADDAAPLALGARVDGEISHAGQVDRYSFTLGERTRVLVDTLRDVSFAWSLSGPRGLAASRGLQSSDSADFGGGNPLLDLVAGSYTFTVDAASDATGAYAFRLLALGSASAITPGTPVSGTLDPGSETDLYSFSAQAGDQFAFDSQSLANSDVYWRLFSPYGDQVFFGHMAQDVQERILDATGTYTLSVEGRRYNGAPNAYAFNVQHLGNLPPVAPVGTPLVLGDPVSSAIAAAGERDVYTFTLAEDARLVFDSRTNSNTLRWSLAGPRGLTVGIRGFAQSDSWDGNSLLDLVAGDYALTVEASGSATGAYGFRLSSLASATPLTPGTPVSGQLNPGNETHLYRFEVPEGGARYYFDMQSIANGDARWRLINGYGDDVFSAGLGNDVDVVALAAGSYTLLLEGRSYNTASNAYQFNVQPVVDETAALALGQRVDGAIAHAGQTDRYSFTLTESRQLYFDVLSDSRLDWRLDGPAGAVV
ncbi:MAG TPA: hypothetical protein VH741_04715, partial [Candidatus Limnocylindrales bacterium]